MRFALVTEGITDQLVIPTILCGYFNSPDIETTPLQPETREEVAGWGKVFNYVKSDVFKGAFEWNEYVVIQIDTDTHQDWKKNIPESKQNSEESILNQIGKVKELLIDLMGKMFYEKNKKKIIFAISVQSIECWVLPFHSSNSAHSKKVINCLSTLNSNYLKPKGFTIDPNSKAAKDLKFYEKAIEEMKNHKKLKSVYHKNLSLKVFIESLNDFFPDSKLP